MCAVCVSVRVCVCVVCECVCLIPSVAAGEICAYVRSICIFDNGFLLYFCFFRDAMQIAARNGSIPMMDLIKQWGGSVHSLGPKGDTLFHLCAYNGHLKAMKWLQNEGVAAEAVDMFGQTAVHVAAKRAEPLVLAFLCDELNVDFSHLDYDGLSPLECIPRFGDDDEKKMRITECRRIATAATSNSPKRNKAL